MAGKKFAAEFALRRNVSALDKILIQDSDDDVVKYAYPPQIAALSGYAYAKSIADLPLMPSNKSIGYIVGQMLYIYVGMGGDTKDGLYQSVGFFVGPQGVQGEKGDKGERGEQGVQGPKGDNGGLSLQELDEYLATKQYVTGDTLADMLAGYVSNTSLMRDYVTIAKAQDVTGVKNFTAGLQFGGVPMYKSKGDTVFLDGNLVVRGGITAFGTNETISPSIFEALPIDGATIKRDPITKELYVDTTVVGGGGTSGGGVADSVSWSNITGKPYWIGAEKPSYKYSEIDETPDLSIYATQSWVTGKGYITGITGKMVTNALGYTPLSTSGGTITGDFYIKKPSNATIIFQPNNAAKSFWFGVNTSEEWFCTNGGYTETYKLIHSGNYLSYPVRNPNALSWSGFSSGSYDGSTAQSIVLPTKLSQLTDDVVRGKYLSLAGGTVNGQITSNAVENFVAKGTDYSLYFGIGTGQVNRGIYDLTNNSWMLYRDATNNVIIPQGEVIIGNALSAIPVGPIHRLRLIADNAATYIQAGSASGSNAGTLRLTGYYASQLTALRLHAQAVEATGTLEVTGDITAPTFTGVASNATYWNAPSSIRPTTANVPVVGNTTFSHYLATSSMTTGKPSNDGYIIHGEWDTVAGWSAQLFFSNGSPDPNNRMQWRAMDSGTWGEWKSVAFIDTGMLKPTQGLQINHDGSNYAEGIRLANRNGITNTWSEINFGCDPSVTTGTHATQWTVGRNGNNNYFVIRNFGTDRIQIDLSGNTTLTGNFVATGGVTAQNSSDRRLKRNIRKFNASKVLMSLGGVWEYEYIDSEVRKNHIYEGTHYGLIYQHVKGTTLDVMCHEREDGFGTLSYIHPKFISLIAGATMENISEVEKLKRKIRHLENKVKQLEQRA